MGSLGCCMRHGLALNQISACREAFFNLIDLSGCCHRQDLDLPTLKVEVVFTVIASINTKGVQHEPYH